MAHGSASGSLLARRTPRRLAFATLSTGIVFFAAVTATGLGGAALVDLASSWLYYALIAAAALVCLARVAAIPHRRAPWALIGVALAAWAIADIYWSAALADLDAPPYPSLADAGWLAIYPASYVAVLLLVGRGRERLPAGMRLDHAIAALGASALATALLFGPILAGSLEGSPAAIATNLAYPVGDLLLLALVVVVFSLHGWRPDRVWLVFGAGLVVSAAADTWYLSEVARGTYEEGTLLDVLWPASALLMAWAAWQPERPDPDRQPGGVRLVVIPVAFALSGLGLLVLDHFTRINDVALVLAAGTLAVAVLRMGAAFHANVRMLELSRREARTDALTGLGNRRRLMDDLEASMRPGDGVAPLLVMFDLDGFKRYNDSFGHPAGDALLERLGRALERAVDGHGRAYRMGGDEFCVLVDAAPGDRQERIASATAALAASGQGFAISASHGSVVPALEAATAAEALQIADQRMYEDKSGRSASRSSETRDVLIRILREREPGLHDHITSVAVLAREVGVRVGLLPEALDELARAAELHDVGKMAIPDAILNKSGPLDEREWAFMQRHTLIGESILSAAPALVPVARIVRSSHERVDGTGYPDGLAGDAIPLGARIVAICDAYDAMTSDRSYRRGMSPEAALIELRAGAGTQFDAALVDVFCAVAAGVRSTRPVLV